MKDVLNDAHVIDMNAEFLCKRYVAGTYKGISNGYLQHMLL